MACVAGSLVMGQRSAPYRAPRTPDGQPDLQGIWQVRNHAAHNLEDHGASLGVPAGRGVVEEGAIPYLPAALKQRDENFKLRAERDPLNRCYLPGPLRMMTLPFPLQIFQTAGFVIIASEFAHTVRTVHLQGGHPDGIDFWMGDSRGRFEGDTLVVDVADIGAGSWLDAAGNFHSDKMHMVERYRRIAPDVLEYEATIEDPEVFAKAWKVKMPLYLHKEPGFQLLEYECHVYLEDEGVKK